MYTHTYTHVHASTHTHTYTNIHLQTHIYIIYTFDLICVQRYILNNI